MLEQDKGNFKDMMNSVCIIFGKQTLDKDTLRVWYYKLEKFEFSVVTHAFDKWVDTSKFMPTPADILSLCKEKPVTFTQLAPPTLSHAESKAQADKFMIKVQEHMPKEEKKLKDMKAWAHRIIANPKNYPAISLKTAKEALNAH